MEQYDNSEKVDQRGLEKKSYFVLKKVTMLVMNDALMHKLIS